MSNTRSHGRRLAIASLAMVVVGGGVAAGVIGTRGHADSSTPRSAQVAATAPATTAASATPDPVEASPSPSTVEASPTPAAETPTPVLAGTHLSVAISGLPPQTVVHLGGEKVEFTVTVTNATTHTFRNVGLVVTTDHCLCSNYPTLPAPDGTLAVQQPDGTWKTITYVARGTGMDYANVKQLPTFTLAPGETMTRTYRMGLVPDKYRTFRDGQLAVDATLVGREDYSGVGPTNPVGDGLKVVGLDPAAYAPIGIAIH